MAVRLLPIGTVIDLKDYEGQLMIAGYAAINADEPGIVYDYMGFPYPRGCVTDDGIYYFNNYDIDGVYCVGYQDGEGIKFLAEVEENMDAIKATVAEAVDGSDEE